MACVAWLYTVFYKKVLYYFNLTKDNFIFIGLFLCKLLRLLLLLFLCVSILTVIYTYFFSNKYVNIKLIINLLITTHTLQK